MKFRWISIHLRNGAVCPEKSEHMTKVVNTEKGGIPGEFLAFQKFLENHIETK